MAGSPLHPGAAPAARPPAGCARPRAADDARPPLPGSVRRVRSPACGAAPRRARARGSEVRARLGERRRSSRPCGPDAGRTARLGTRRAPPPGRGAARAHRGRERRRAAPRADRARLPAAPPAPPWCRLAAPALRPLSRPTRPLRGGRRGVVRASRSGRRELVRPPPVGRAPPPPGSPRSGLGRLRTGGRLAARGGVVVPLRGVPAARAGLAGLLPGMPAVGHAAYRRRAGGRGRQPAGGGRYFVGMIWPRISPLGLSMVWTLRYVMPRLRSFLFALGKVTQRFFGLPDGLSAARMAADAPGAAGP